MQRGGLGDASRPGIPDMTYGPLRDAVMPLVGKCTWPPAWWSSRAYEYDRGGLSKPWAGAITGIGFGTPGRGWWKGVEGGGGVGTRGW